ncbi:MAG: type II secretion system ATPase GspE [Rhizobiaceae bacterium]|nr:type II secretion system ATPase GspE [Rhizobiaceae bacterium]
MSASAIEAFDDADQEPAYTGSAPVLPYPFARAHGAVLRRQGDGLVQCVHRPALSLDAFLEIQRVAGSDLSLLEVEESEFEKVMGQEYRNSATEAAEEAAAADTDLAALADSAAAVDDLLDQRNDAPVVRLINALLLEAVKEGASDIHIETHERRLAVRFRVDGVLRKMIEPKRSLAPLLVSRIKVMARLDIAEKRLPQDGRVSLRVGDHEVDVRVSTIPSQYGERVVMRLLDRDATRPGCDAIGMGERDQAVFERMLRRPEGILLVTGPTGSGKTTTLYAALGDLNDNVRNIMTVEDPIEYTMEGIGQTQVNPRTDLTFARGLRAILRQDPDVIMVGEIRDGETAQVAVQASMTGHLVLSTLHTNSAIGSVTRLIDMGVERFLLAPMLTGLIAQRLGRTLCAECRVPDRASAIDRDLLGGKIEIGAPLFRPLGCPACFGNGYRGRTGIYEVVEIDSEREALIHNGVAEAELVEAARRKGPSLLEDGARKVAAGLTSVEEVTRVSQAEAAPGV